MSAFYAYMEQDGGCDYTIGCGKNLLRLPEAKTAEEAVQHVVGSYDHYFNGDGSELVDRFTILEVVEETPIDVANLRTQLAEREVATAAKEFDDRERSEFERLRAKFGDKS